MREGRASLFGAPGASESTIPAARDVEHPDDHVRRALERASRAVERAGRELGWVKRLAKRLAKRRERRRQIPTREG